MTILSFDRWLGTALGVLTLLLALFLVVTLVWFVVKSKKKAAQIANRSPEWVWALYAALCVIVGLATLAYGALQYPQFDVTTSRKYEEVLNATLALQRDYNRLISIFDWTTAGVRILEITGFGIGTLFLVVGQWLMPKSGKDPLAELKKLAPWVGGVLVVTVVLIHGVGFVYGTDIRRQAYGQASVVLGCVVEATGDSTEDKRESSFILWSAVHRIQASTVASLNELTLGEARSESRRNTGGLVCTQCDRVEACLTRLPRNVGIPRRSASMDPLPIEEERTSSRTCE